MADPIAVLEAELTMLAADVKEAKARKRTVARKLEQAIAERDAATKLAGMSPAERKVLAQALGVASIPSGEAVGTPGA